MERTGTNGQPPDRPYWLQRICVAGMAAGVGALLLSKFGLIPLPPWGVFSTMLILIVLGNVLCWAWADRWLARYLDGWRCRSWRLVHGAFFIFAIALLGTVFAVGRDFFDALPIALIMWVLSWNLIVFCLAVVLTGLELVRFLVGVFFSIFTLPLAKSVTSKVSGCPPDRLAESGDCAKKVDPSVRLSRRALLARSAMLTPVLLSGGFVAGGLYQADRFVVRRISLKLPRLPDRLRGLTITHLSDLHVGRLFRPEHLSAMVEASNKLGSDLVAITGDILDHSNDFLPAAAEAISQLEHRYGRFLVIGNHDLIDDPRMMLSYLDAREPNLLCDRMKPMEIGGERVRIAGLFWSRYEHPRGNDPGHVGRVEATLGRLADRDTPVGSLVPPVEQEPFTIGLVHHPHAFDALADRGVDLTLAGHTHGGQVMLTPPGWSERIGAGNLLFRYLWGEYRRGDSLLYVNAGVGNWFPLRVNAPAEIVQLRLI
ncbi:MAG: hypothetical protein GXY44_12300 [Phycisphaerales bacterium]|nr:hypothetical protein [Phycisphaerales bacterium]